MNIRRATEADVQALSDLINRENNAQTSAAYLQNWYWNNPLQSSSVILCEKGGSVLGMASTNNFRYNIAGKSTRVAMPQKVLTADAIRGQGFFSKLYFKNEADNFESEKVDCFLTITNAASTPIFLKKFAYVKGLGPRIVILPSIPFVRGTANYRPVASFSETFLSAGYLMPSDNSLVRDVAYYMWRYQKILEPNGKGYEIIEVHAGNVILGYAVLKRSSKKGLPFYYLMDAVSTDRAGLEEVFRCARKYARSKGAIALFAIENTLTADYLRKQRVKKTINERFNFLVKGKNAEESQDLSKVVLNFCFGDLDFL